MTKKIGIVQSNYIPWKGYFDFINAVDEFVLFDDVQYTRRDWRNRNLIKTPNGLQWLTIPVEVKGKYFQKINSTRVADQKWRIKHWETLKHTYSKAEYFNEIESFIKPIYDSNTEYLSEINAQFLKAICNYLNINTLISFSSDYELEEGKNERLIHICKQAHASIYISGSAAKSYINERLFLKDNIEVRWMSYEGYDEYPQFHPPFEHGVSILDLLFHTGKDAKSYMLASKKEKK